MNKVIRQSKSTDKKIDAQLKLAELYWKYNPDSSIIIINNIFKINKLKQNSFQNCVALRTKGLAFVSLEKQDSALVYFNRALDIAYAINDHLKITSILGDLGLTYSDLSAYKLSSKYLLDAIKYYEQHKDSINAEVLPYFYNSLSINYANLKQYETSNKYIKKGLAVASIPSIKSSLLNNLSINYLESKDYSNAKKYFDKSMTLDKKSDFTYKLNNTYISYANFLAETNQINLANQYIDSAINYFRSINDDFALAYCYDIKGNIYRVKKEFSTAEQYLLKCKNALEAFEDYDGLKDNLYNLYLLNNDKENYKLSLEYYKRYKTIEDSIANAALASDIYYLDEYYETEKKETQINLLEKDNLLKQSKLKRNMIILIAIALLSLLLLYLVNVLRKSNQFKTETNAILQEKNQQLKTLNATKDKLFSIVAHDLKNPLSAFRNITNALQKQIFNLSKEEINEFLLTINDSSNKLFELLQNMLKWSLSQTNNIKVNLQEQAILPISQKAVDALQYNAAEKNITINNTIDNTIQANIDDNIIETIIRNYISNAIKFTPNNGTILLYSEILNDKKIKVGVKDNGIGISENDQQKIFNIEADTSTVGNSSEKGTGLGLILCKELAEKMNANVGFNSEIKQGSDFYIIFNM
ncbi:MAG: HAMP domain-containing histidine kinase [Chitinophagales bacterium]|nr:HAMP domain-containing histidine kinase [Chitinophagales bacterium]